MMLMLKFVVASLVSLATSIPTDDNINDVWELADFSYAPQIPCMNFTLTHKIPYYCVAGDTVPCAFINGPRPRLFCGHALSAIPSLWQDCNYLLRGDGTPGQTVHDSNLKWRANIPAGTSVMDINFVMGYPTKL
jgi:hypothetical protein